MKVNIVQDDKVPCGLRIENEHVENLGHHVTGFTMISESTRKPELIIYMAGGITVNTEANVKYIVFNGKRFFEEQL